ncbi:protoporphyrinogen/coproporphyrinogen III oxidase [Gammaproteobacteria bacterium]
MIRDTLMQDRSPDDLLVVGAGVSGLAAAHYGRQQGWSVRVLESSDRPGGCLHSPIFPGSSGFWLELGAHTCFNSYGHLLDILTDVDGLSAVIPKARLNYRLWVNGRDRFIPGQLHWGELLRSLPRLRSVHKASARVADYYGAMVGPRNYREVLGPAFNAVICQEAAEFPAASLFRKRTRRKDQPKNFSFPGGLSWIVRRLTESLGERLLCGAEAVSVTSQGDQGFEVVLATGQRWQGRRLVLATPPQVAAGLLAGMAPALSALLGEIQGVRVESLGVCVSADQIAWPRLAGLIGVAEDFFSVVSRDYQRHIAPDLRGFTFHFRPGRLSLEEKRQQVARVLGVSPADFLAVTDTVHTLPALRLGQNERVERMDGLLKGQPLALTGNYFHGLSIEDCLVRTRAEIHRLAALCAG